MVEIKTYILKKWANLTRKRNEIEDGLFKKNKLEQDAICEKVNKKYPGI